MVEVMQIEVTSLSKGDSCGGCVSSKKGQKISGNFLELQNFRADFFHPGHFPSGISPVQTFPECRHWGTMDFFPGDVVGNLQTFPGCRSKLLDHSMHTS